MSHSIQRRDRFDVVAYDSIAAIDNIVGDTRDAPVKVSVAVEGRALCPGFPTPRRRPAARYAQVDRACSIS
jgi:hypothetical protein